MITLEPAAEKQRKRKKKYKEEKTEKAKKKKRRRIREGKKKIIKCDLTSKLCSSLLDLICSNTWNEQILTVIIALNDKTCNVKF